MPFEITNNLIVKTPHGDIGPCDTREHAEVISRFRSRTTSRDCDRVHEVLMLYERFPAAKELLTHAHDPVQFGVKRYWDRV